MTILARCSRITAVLALLTSPGASQEIPTLEWLTLFGETSNNQPVQVIERDSGGYVVVGDASSNDSSGILLAAFDGAGTKLWLRTLEAGEFSRASDVKQTSDGGYVITGAVSMHVNGVNDDVLLLKTDDLGHQEWVTSFGGGEEDVGWSVVQTADGGYAVAGATRSFGAGGKDFYLIRTDADGNERWSRTFGGAAQDRCYTVLVTGDDEFVMGGETRSFGAGGVDAYLVKTDAMGTQLWAHTYGSTGDDYARSLHQTGDGGYILAGGSWGIGESGTSQTYLVRTDSSGHETWTRRHSDPEQDSGKSVVERSEGGFVVATSSGLLRTDPDGHLLWAQTWEEFGGDLFQGWFIGWAVKQTRDEGYVVTGYFDQNDDDIFDGFLLKLGSETKPSLRRGDSNADSTINIADAIFTLSYLFTNGATPSCLDAADTNDDGAVDLADATYTLQRFFASGPAIPEPSPGCGADTTADALACAGYPPCE